MAELIYSVANIFNDKTSDGCLYQYEAKKFHIPAYQRGYKWGSENENDPVPTLLNDLYNNYTNTPDKKYYLQYITISKKGDLLEVIDGQQRLTTLSILLSVFNAKLSQKNEEVSGKLHYAIRSDFFDENIYPVDRLKALLQCKWDKKTGILIDNKNINNQDVYYIFHAALKINEFLIRNNCFEPFRKFILENVMIIVNSVESHIPGEKVFRNLNSNKVPLTEVDLIKGLLLTRVARHTDDENQKKRYREVLEIRTSLGKQWDEIAIGVNEPDFKDFFFKTDDGLQGLVKLVALMNDYEIKSEETHYPVFNFYNKNIKRILHYFEDLKVAYGVLRNWYNDPKTYNLLGFYFYSQGKKDYSSQLIFLKENIKLSKKELIDILIEMRKNILPEKVGDASYQEGKDDVHNILLALNVFSNDIKEYRFDFYRFKKHEWTLEHIFPQSPEGKGQTLNEKQKAVLKEMLGGPAIESRMNMLIDKDVRTEEEKDEIQESLNAIGVLHTIGNMTLLSRSINSSLSCGMFDAKRTGVLTFIEKGYFVPVHTFGVFSKSIFGNNPGDFLAWDKANITAHQQFIVNKISKLREEVVAV